MFAYCMDLRALGRDNASSRRSQKISQPGQRASQPTSHCAYIYANISVLLARRSYLQRFWRHMLIRGLVSTWPA